MWALVGAILDYNQIKVYGYLRLEVKNMSNKMWALVGAIFMCLLMVGTMGL